MSEQPRLRIHVHPEPDECELTAITAAVVAATKSESEEAPPQAVNKWRDAGKRETMHDTTWETRK